MVVQVDNQCAICHVVKLTNKVERYPWLTGLCKILNNCSNSVKNHWAKWGTDLNALIDSNYGYEILY